MVLRLLLPASVLVCSCVVSAREGTDALFDLVIGKARALAEGEYVIPSELPGVLRSLNYDQYRAIQTAADAVIWEGTERRFRLELLHAGYLFQKPVRLNFVKPDRRTVVPLPFEKKWFDYSQLVVHEDFDESAVGGFAGFRIRHPLNGGPQDFDEIGSFIGASYFRLLGKDQSYGISARGLAINSVIGEPVEEFPDFVEYWIVEPEPGSGVLEMCALLDSPSVAGAYRFAIRPGVTTSTDIDVRLFFRKENPSVGLAPLTSMYWFGENHKERPFMDWRPEVHDSDGLLFRTWNDEVVWRPFYNHHAIRNTYFDAPDVKGFGVLQRDRDFANYQDLSNPYWLTPSAWVEPKGQWGTGAVRLVELPTNNEAMDNIVAFFEPQEKPKAGSELAYSYTLGWKMNDETALSPNRVVATRLGEIGAFPDTRRFIVDFIGPELEGLPADAPMFAEITSSANGYVTENQCFKNVKTKGWRVEFKMDTDDGDNQPVELRCFLKHPETGERLSETWSYQWSP